MTAGRAAINLTGLLILTGTGVIRAESIAPGVEHTIYNLSGPKVVYVVAIDRLRSEYKLDVGWPQEKRNFTSRQRTSTIAGLYDDPPDHDVLAATNASFFAETPVIIGTAASHGEILEMPAGSFDTFLFGPSRLPVIRSQIDHVNGTLTFANGTTTTLHQYNRPLERLVILHAITAYTPGWDSSTRSDFIDPSLAVEVILDNVSYPMRGDKEVSGIVTAIRTGSASLNNDIPAGGMVLTAWGNSQADVVANTQVGDRLRMSFVTTASDYNNADMAVSGAGWIIHDGTANTGNWANYDSSFVTSRHPRTVLGWNDTHLFMMVVDGRQPGYSIGMTFQEMADFLTGTLGALDAVNLDGGGSSTMVVDGTVRNSPSDGSERYVANAVLLVKKDTATAFPVGDPFSAGGRLAGWDDKFTYNAVAAFSPASPGGDGYVIEVADPAGGVETTRRGDFGDADYTVEADIYCEYRPGDSGDGFERYGLFARDSGAGAFGLASYGGGNCYALVYDSDDGRIRAGKYVGGTLTTFFVSDPMPTAWRRFRIDCYGSTIEYRLDETLIASVTDTTHTTGCFGIGYHEFFATNSNMHATRADNLLAFVDTVPTILGDFDLDGDVDQEDFGHLQECFTGSGHPQTQESCLDARLDDGSDVDQNDFALFQKCMSGPDVSAVPGCTGLE